MDLIEEEILSFEIMYRLPKAYWVRLSIELNETTYGSLCSENMMTILLKNSFNNFDKKHIINFRDLSVVFFSDFFDIKNICHLVPQNWKSDSLVVANNSYEECFTTFFPMSTFGVLWPILSKKRNNFLTTS